MEITKKEVLETALLINLAIDDAEIEMITESFVVLINYFKVLDTVMLDTNDEDKSDDIFRLRDGHVAIERVDTERLVENSEEYEDNYILIPNIL